jgi:hypothetical protein
VALRDSKACEPATADKITILPDRLP